eukprot:97885-Amphidinium_carterae.1
MLILSSFIFCSGELWGGGARGGGTILGFDDSLPNREKRMTHHRKHTPETISVKAGKSYLAWGLTEYNCGRNDCNCNSQCDILLNTSQNSQDRKTFG